MHELDSYILFFLLVIRSTCLVDETFRIETYKKSQSFMFDVVYSVVMLLYTDKFYD